MGRFGFKKNEDEDSESSRLALFGNRSKSKSPAPPSNNPYAQAAPPPDPYTQAKMNAGILPPGGSQGGPAGGPHRGPGPQGGYGSSQGSQDRYGAMPPRGQEKPSYGAPPNAYGNDNKYGGSQGGYGGGGYGAEKFGNQNGYGAGGSGGNPYSQYSQTGGTSRAGGYGGLGPSHDDGPDNNRDELFGGARERVEQRQQNPPGGGPPGYSYQDGNAGGDRSFGAYGDRQLTAEEEEEEDITATKQDIKFMKQQDVASTRNALRIAAEAEEMGRNTLARLGAQGERMHNTDRNLDIGNNHINIAEDKTRELKTLNRSMFAVHMNNPFTAKDRRARRDEQIMDRHHAEREAREATREAAFKSTQRMNQNFTEISKAGIPSKSGASLAERSKYQFEADSEDDAMEEEIDRNLDQLSGAAKRLNLLARATGEEVESQNQLIQRIAEKSDKFDDRLHFQTEKLRRIH